MNVSRLFFFIVLCFQPPLFATPVVSLETVCQMLDRELAIQRNPYVRAGGGPSQFSDKIRQAELSLQQARKDKNLEEQKRVIKELVQIYEADGRPMEAVWTLRTLGRSEYADKLVAQIEESLREAKVVTSRPLGGGRTETVLVTLESGLQGVFKPNDTINKWASNSSYEVAAYRIDEILGLNLVPVTVMANIGGRVGSLQYFVKNTMLGGDKSKDLLLFDYLVANVDRNNGNYLTRPGGQVVAIDHGMIFKKANEIPDLNMISSQAVVEKLRNVSIERLEAEVKPLLASTSRPYLFQHFIKRISAMVEMVEKAIAERGVEGVFAP